MRAYLSLLFKDRLAMLRPSSYRRGNDRKARMKSTAAAVGFIVLVLYLLGVFIFLEKLMFDAFVKLGEPQTFMTILFLACSVVTLLAGFFFVFSSLFFNKDTQMIAAMPLTSRQALTARLAMVLLSESLISFAVCMPAVIMYGIYVGMGVGYYLKAVIFVPFLPCIPVAIVTLLASLLIRVSALWKRREGVTVVAGFVLVLAVVIGELQLTRSIPQENTANFLLNWLMGRKQLLTLLSGIYPPAGWLTLALTGAAFTGLLQGILFVIAGLLALSLVVMLTGKGYLGLAIRQTETLTRLSSARKRQHEDSQRGPLWALYRRELNEIFTVPMYALNSLVGVVLFPVMLGVLLFGGQSRLEGLGVIIEFLRGSSPILLLLIVTAVLSLPCAMNVAGYTAVSREGKSNDFRKLIPVPAKTQLQAKLLMGMTINALVSLPMAILCAVAMPSMWAYLFVGWLLATVFSLLVTALGILLDAYRPRFNWRTETEAIKQNVNEVISMFGAMALLLLLSVAVYWLIAKGIALRWILLGIVVLLLLGAFGSYLALIKRGAKRYSLQETSK